MTRNYNAFTLAEVLITLVIVGVIAVMTIPTLINKTNNQEYVSRLKKTYSTLAQATNRIIADEGTPRGDIGGWATSAETVYNMYKKYLNKAKECGEGTGCMSQTYKSLDGAQQRNYDNNPHATHRKLVLSDGVQVMFLFRSLDCSTNVDGTNSECAQINVDLNGEKGPNVFGRDLFEFAVKETVLIPVGCDFGECPNSNGGITGADCACKVLREGAINY